MPDHRHKRPLPAVMDAGTFQRRFGTDEVCWEHLRNTRWGPNLERFIVGMDRLHPDLGGGAKVADDFEVRFFTEVLDTTRSEFIRSHFSLPATVANPRWADTQPRDLDFKISIVDVTRALDGFSGAQYPFAPSKAAACP